MLMGLPAATLATAGLEANNRNPQRYALLAAVAIRAISE
jgi:hypothetical protein